ncbi:MAG: response regulator [Armatimonadetes bacterium]|nr:response regulator [Armatimonadota bacterium]
MIVEDDDLLRELSAELMRALGFSPEVVVSLAEARERLQGATTSLVILDNSLPDGQGVDLLADMDGAWATTPVIICTGQPQALSGRESRVLERPRTVVLGKPFTVSELQAAIARCLDSCG